MDPTLTNALHKHRLDALAGMLDALWWPSATLAFAPASLETVAPGASRAGGSPDLPPGFAWPAFRDWPLHFLFQLDLTAAAPFLGENTLPTRGWLVLFGVADEKAPDAPAWITREKTFAWSDVFQVRFIDAPLETLARTPAPGAGPALPCHSVVMTAGRSLPRASSPHVTDRLRAESQPPTDAATTGAHGAASPRVSNTAARYDEMHGEVAVVRDHLLGHPSSIQDDVLVEAVMEVTAQKFPLPPAALDAVYQSARAWRLLLQLDSNAHLGWQFVNDGRLYIALPAEDLAAQRFERARTIMQR